MKRLALLAMALGLLVAACSKEEVTDLPPPVATVPDATGYYCGMLLAEHEGPKGQILLESSDRPVWFTSVRDTFTFLVLPEEPKDVAAVYVSDMGKATSWDQPGNNNWILADNAFYVIESDRVGGMGGAEAVPFGDKAAAQDFVGQHGGRVVPFEDAKSAMTKEGTR